jgi:hypothetical protein
MINWYVGWSLLLTAFLTGALIGLYHHDDNFLGGYGSFRRRMLRLGHIAFAALGMLNILYAQSAPLIPSSVQNGIAVWGLVIGGISMPIVCFLSAWRECYRHLFFIPVVALLAAVVQILANGPPATSFQ